MLDGLGAGIAAARENSHPVNRKCAAILRTILLGCDISDRMPPASKLLR